MDRDNPIDVDAEPQPPATKQQQQHAPTNGPAAQSSSSSASSSSSSARPIFALRIPKSVMEWRKAGLHFDYDLITPEAVARDTAGLRTQIRDLQDKVRTNQEMEKQVVVHRELLNAELAMAKAENERLNEALVKQRAEAQYQMGLVEKLKEQLEKRTAELRDEQTRFVSAVGSVNRMRSERNALRAEVARLKAPPSAAPTRVKLEEDMDMQIIQDSVVPPAPTVSPVTTNRSTSPAQSTVVAEAPLVEDSPVVEQSPTQQATGPSIPLPPNLKRKRSPEPAPRPPQSEPAPKRTRTPEPAPVPAPMQANLLYKRGRVLMMW